MEVIFRISGNILISCIKGEVDHHSAMPLRQAIDKSMKAFDCSDLILDFSGVEFMDSSGIGVVLGRYKKLNKSGGRICISGCSKSKRCSVWLEYFRLFRKQMISTVPLL